MHSQVLVIYPEDVSLEDIMYWYQEVDKTQQGRMADERCQFSLEVKEEEIPLILLKIKERLEKKLNEFQEYVKYRSKHTLKEFQEKYGRPFKDWYFGYYTETIEDLNEYELIKDLPIDDPRQIKFMKDECYWATDKITDIYINGRGYGYYDNPYGMWDYYNIIDEHRFPRGTKFLVNKAGGKDNTMDLNSLDVDKTISNIKEYTRVWEHIIFCEKTPDDSRLYTLDDIRFNEEWNKDCLITDLEEKLRELTMKYNKGNYIITAIDTHW